MTKSKSTLRIILSSLALVAFLGYTIFDNISLTEFESYHSFSFRFQLLNDIFVFIPFLALFVLSILERKLKFLDPHVYVLILFTVFLFQHMLRFFVDEMCCFSLFCDDTLLFSEYAYWIIFFARIFIFAAVPFLGSDPLKIYSGAMIGMSLVVAIAMLTSPMKYGVADTCIRSAIDILFHVTLFFFADFLKKDKGASTKGSFIERIAYYMDILFSDDATDDSDKRETNNELTEE